MFMNEFQDHELALDDRLLRKIQAHWRGAAVRNSLRKVHIDYAEVFEEIEQNPSCSIQWRSAKHAIVGKPQFVPLDRRNCPRLDSAKMEEPVNSDARLPSMQNCSSEQLQPVPVEPDSTRMNLELLNNDEPVILLPQTDTSTSDVSPTDVQNNIMSVKQHVLDACGDNPENHEDILVDRAGRDNYDSATVLNGVALEENCQTSSTGVPVSLVGSTLQEQRHNLALELLWVQQAIHSRKQYLRLKSQLAERSSS